MFEKEHKAGTTLVDTGPTPEEVIAELEHGFEDADAAHGYADVLTSRAQFGEAAVVIDRIIQDDPVHVEALLNLASVYAKSAKYCDAFELFRRAVRSAKAPGVVTRLRALLPGSRIMDYLLARAFAAEGHPREALGQFRKILTQDEQNGRPSSYEVKREMVHLLEQLGEPGRDVRRRNMNEPRP